MKDDDLPQGQSGEWFPTRRSALAVIAGGLCAPMERAGSVDVDAPVSVVGLLSAIPNLNIPTGVKYVRTTGHSVTGVGGALYRRIVTAHTSRYARRPYQIRDASGALWELAEAIITPQMLGPTGKADDFATFQAWAQTTVALGRPWLIPSGDYVLNGATELILTTGGTCHGRLLIPKANTACRFVFARDAEGSAVNTASWGALTRGTRDAKAHSALGKHVLLESSEIMIERDGGGSAPYTRQEFVRCDRNGAFTTPLTCTYNNRSQLLATAYAPASPITVRGLRIHRTGALGDTAASRGVINCRRDSVTFDGLTIINDDPTKPLSVMMEIGYCADVVLNRPLISGANDIANGLGYGLLFATTIGCRVNQPQISDCREAISGRHNTDLHILGGRCSYAIDDHWGNRMRIEGTIIECARGGAAVQYAGNDIALIGVQQRNGRALLVIRNDTPSLGGNILISRPSIVSHGESEYYMFSLSSPNGTSSIPSKRGPLPVLPDNILMDGGSVDVDAKVAWLAYLSVVRTVHRNWGEVLVKGAWRFAGNSIKMGVVLFKDSNYQTGRATKISVLGSIDFGEGYAAYVTADDKNTRLAAIVRVASLKSGNLRLSSLGIGTLVVDGGSIGSIENDDPRQTNGGRFEFYGVDMRGGFIRSTLTNLHFSGCTFTGKYTDFPPPQNVELINVRISNRAEVPDYVNRKMSISK